jgi:GNAT superfamily N-acetyltransferase
MEIRALRPSDDRSRFSSGNLDLDRFLSKYAGQNQFANHIGATYVAVEGALILGFVTVAPGQIEAADLPPSTLTGRLPRYPVPILRLARMAVARSLQRQGVGSELLRFVFELALKMSRDYGCTGVTVDAKPEAVGFYERFDFRRKEAASGLLHTGPKPVMLFLNIHTIKDGSQG